MDRDRSEAGKALASMRRTATFVCEYCGAEFTARVDSTRPPRFCSSSHRSAAFNREKRAAAKAAKLAAEPPPQSDPPGDGPRELHGQGEADR